MTMDRDAEIVEVMARAIYGSGRKMTIDDIVAEGFAQSPAGTSCAAMRQATAALAAYRNATQDDGK